ncbi:unnamed protein product [Phytophthora fragariaefolia]|uniref:Unnamed protein product n=1 Tax=Phytophthora fragariaefolia TaxID=1490495 RepID=A0A9W7CUS3_9STRA|nr:unnamed protein product [Phytophthora fragariaefolia]
MGREDEPRAAKWSFTETLSLDEVELRERQVLEDGDVFSVWYAHSIQGRETAKITYRELRKVCSYLGVRYYKNKTKGVMLELIAQMKIRGQVPESYRFLKRAEKKVKMQRTVVHVDAENRDPAENNEPVETRDRVENQKSECHLLSTSRKRQRTAVEPISITSSSATNTFLQPVSPTASEQRSSSTGYGSGIPSTPESATGEATVEMSLKERSDTFTLLRHVRQQIVDVEDEIAALTENGVVQLSDAKTERLVEDLHFYLSERRALMQQLESSRCS